MGPAPKCWRAATPSITPSESDVALDMGLGLDPASDLAAFTVVDIGAEETFKTGVTEARQQKDAWAASRQPRPVAAPVGSPSQDDGSRVV